jgi:L-lactate dehydrogenase complex protein LldG
VLLAAAPEALRTTGLLPPSHIVVLPRERLVPGFEELFEQMPGFVAASSQLVLVTGPSRTSDIEMTLVRGVHGPGRVAVLVVSA